MSCLEINNCGMFWIGRMQRNCETRPNLKVDTEAPSKIRIFFQHQEQDF